MNNKVQHNILRAFVGLSMLSGSVCLMAQNEPSDSVERRKPKAAPVYQMKEVSGYVYDASTKKPIDGARVQAYNNALYSVLTDETGKYTLKLPTFVNSLYITVPEYNDVQVSFNGAEAPNVKLYSDKFNSFYSQTTEITAKRTVDIETSSAISVDGEIENKLGGDVRTISRTGMPGQGVAMFIRGLNSININAQPLIVLDGMMMDMQLDRTSIHDGFFNNILAGIDVEDIESVEVLKNGTSLYGARGGNGVILINTKRGRSLATKINVSVYGGIETMPSMTKMMNADQYKNYTSELIGTTELGQNSTSANYLYPFLNDDPNYYWYPMYHNNTDWSDGLYQTAFSHNYKVNVQGGDNVAMYNLSLGYSSVEATAKNNSMDRLNIRFNTDIKLLENLNTQLDVSYSRVTYDLRNNGWAEDYSDGAISSPNVLGLIQAPFLSKYAYYTGEDGKLHESSVYAGKDVDDDNYPFAFASAFGSNAALANPYWILENGDGSNKNTQELTQFNLNVMPRWDISKHLYVTNRFSYQLNRSNEKLYLPEFGMPVYNLEGYGDVTSVIKSLFGKETSLSNDFRINWSNRYGAHDVALYGGFRFISNTFNDNYMSGYNSGNDKMPDFKNSSSFRSVNGTTDSWRNMAYYANARYGYKNTYFLEGALTAEASSRFGKDAKDGLDMFGVKWGIFPSVQAAWVLTNEKWLANVKGLDYLKLTVGYDESGNDNVDYSASRTYFMSKSFLKTATGLQLANVENPEIQWETTRRWNFGLTGSFFNNRLQAGVDFYVNNTDNLLTLKSVNYMSGLKHYWCNEGSIRNTGVDVNLNAIVVNGKDFKWQLGATIGHYKNKVTSLPEGDYTTNVYGAEILTSVGNPVGLFYGYRTEGVFATDADAKAAGKNGDYLKYPTGIKNDPYKNFQSGDVHFSDMDGNGVIDSKDKTVIGDPNPDIYGNIYTNLSYKRWSLDVNFKYSLGNDVYNYQRSQLESLNGFYNQTLAAVNRWTCEGQQTDMPRVCSPDSEGWVNNERFSDRWIEDGSYLKLKKVRLSYEMPLNLSWIQGLTVWAEANNVFVLTKYTGNDPEFSCGNSVLYQGIDAGLLQQGRSFNLGVKINL